MEVDEILSISIVDGTGNVLHDGLYKPRWVKAWPDAARVNDIWPVDVRDCPSIDEDVPAIERILTSADEVIAYNAAFDLAFVACLGIDLPASCTVLDPMIGFAEVYGEWSDIFHDWKWKKLTTAAKCIGYEWTGRAHGSLADARAALAVQDWLEQHERDGHEIICGGTAK